MANELVVYVCTRCTTTAGEGGTCDVCGGQRTPCRPGGAEDPGRRPLIDSGGRVLTRAPIWWLRYTVPALVEQEQHDG